MSPELLPGQVLDIARLAAQTAGKIQKEYYQRAGLRIDCKSSEKDLVTEADRACDEAVIQLLREKCPQDSILTEESFQEGSEIDLSRAWVLDPIDGTTNFAHGFPFFCVSIAYLVNGQPEVGVVYDAMHDECFHAIRGQGAYLNDQPMTISQIDRLDKALLATGFPASVSLQDNMRNFQSFMEKTHGVRRAGSAALDLVYVACGRLDGFWELGLSPWDVAAGALIVQEAGGLATASDSGPLRLDQRRIDILAVNNPMLQAQIIETLRENLGMVV